MKRKISSFMMALIAIVFLTGCPGPKPEPVKLEVSPSTVTLVANTASFSVSSNASWIASSNVSWLRVSPSEGDGNGNVTVTATEDNPSTSSERTGTITISDVDMEERRTVTVKQPATPPEPYLSINKEELEFDYAGGKQSITVSSNIEWTASCDSSWVKVEPASGNNNQSLSIEVFAYEGEVARVAVLKVTGQGLTKTVKLTQGPLLLSVDRTNLIFSALGGDTIVTVTSNANWTATSDAAWCKVVSNKGTGSPADDGTVAGTVAITVEPNGETSARTANVTVQAGGVKRNISIVQSKQQLEINPEDIKIDASATTKDITVKSNTDWTVSSDTEWCKITPAKGTGDGTVKLVISANDGATDRVATVTIKTRDVTRITTVTQYVKNGVTPASLAFNAAGGISNVTVTSSTPWTVTSSATWCKVDKSEGNGSGSITVTVDENGNGEDRTATLTFSFENGDKQTVTVTQAKLELQVKPETMTFEGEAGNQTFVIVTSVAWTIESNAEWCTVSTAKGKGNSPSITVNVTENPSAKESRAADITVKAGELTRTLKVTQNPISEVLSVSPGTMNMDVMGESKEATVTSNTNWTVNVKNESGGDWCEVKPLKGDGNGKLTITSKQNTTESENKATITIATKDLTKTITVTQDAASLKVLQTGLTFENTGGSKALTIQSNIPWTVTSSESWLTLSDNSGTGNKSITATAAGNTTTDERKAELTVKAGNIVRTVSVTQSPEPLVLEINPTSAEFKVDSDGTTFDVTSNTEWTVTSNQTWCAVNPSEGSKGGTVSVGASKNSSSNEREAVITVKAKKDANLARTFTVKQAGIILSVSSATLNFSPDGGNQSFDVTANSTWTVSSNQNWCKVGSQSGTGDQAGISVKVDSYTLGTDRDATITIKSGDVTQTIAVKQSGVSLEVTPAPKVFNKDGDSQDFTISCNTAWTVNSDNSWCIPDQESGSGNASLKVTCKSNPSTDERNAVVTVQAGTIKRALNIKQGGADVILVLNPEKLDFTIGGESKDLAIESNTSWTASSDQNWCTINQTQGSGSGTLSVKASANDGGPRSANITVKAGNLTRICSVTQEGIVLDVTPDQTTIQAEGGDSKDNFTVTTNYPWTATSSESWCTLNKTSGDGSASVSVSAPANPLTSQRTATITFKAGTKEKTVSVTQTGSDPYIILSVDNMSFEVSGGNKTFDISSNISWTVNSSDGWCTVETTNGSGNKQNIQVSAAANTGDERTATVTVKGGNITRSITVTQKGVELSVTPNSTIELSASGTKKQVVVTSNTSWTASPNQDWCVVSPQSGSGSLTYVDIAALENTSVESRDAVVSFKAGDKVVNVAVSQKGATPVLTVSLTTLSYDAAGGDKTFDISSNLSWSVSSSETWCSVSQNTGSGDATITVTATASTSESIRTATVSVKGGDITRNVAITQQGAQLFVSPLSLSFNQGGESKDITVTSNLSWEVSSNATWCTVNKTSGSGSDTFKVTTTANNSENIRTATVTVKSGSISKEIAVSQSGVQLSVDNSSLSFTNSSGSKTVIITCNTSWTAASDQTWCSLNSASGTGAGAITVTVTANNSSNQRTANITVKAGEATRTVTVTQSGEIILQASPQSLSFTGAGGTQSFSVTSNTSWTASSNQSWCTLSTSSGTGNATLNVTAAVNNSSARTATITLTAGNKNVQVTVSQSARIPGEGDNPLPNYSRGKK